MIEVKRWPKNFNRVQVRPQSGSKSVPRNFQANEFYLVALIFFVETIKMTTNNFSIDAYLKFVGPTNWPWRAQISRSNPVFPNFLTRFTENLWYKIYQIIWLTPVHFYSFILRILLMKSDKFHIFSNIWFSSFEEV